MTASRESFRYDTSGQWYKGGVHLHSTASDGGKTFKELAETYASAGYDFLFRTDHWVASDISLDAETYPLLWLDGVEIDGQDHKGISSHVVCLGLVKDIKRDDGLLAGLRSAREQGALLVLAHPHWSGNSPGDSLDWRPDGVEIYNHVCHWLNGKSNGMVHWEAMLRNELDALAFSVDDGHLRPEHPGWNGGWIMVNARKLSAPEILAAIRRGNFYSSCGPEFKAVDFDGENIHMTTSPVQFVRLAGPASNGQRMGSFDGQLLTQASMKLSPDWDYVYAEIEDEKGRRAWTNTLFRRGDSNRCKSAI